MLIVIWKQLISNINQHHHGTGYPELGGYEMVRGLIRQLLTINMMIESKSNYF